MIGAGVALLTALSYAEMATTFPAAGAEYIYIRHTWPGADWLAFGVGVTILLGGAAMATTVALAFGGWRLRESSWLNILFTSIEIAGLALVNAVGLLYGGPAVSAPAAEFPAVVAAAALLFFVFLGFEEIANLAEEVRNPARDVPLALFVSGRSSGLPGRSALH